MVTSNVPFISIGNASAMADPFLAFLRRVFWRDRAPTLAESVFAITWTLDHAIQTMPGGLADPMQIIVLEQQRSGAKWQARELDANELREHREAITTAEAALRSFRETLAGSPGAVEAPPIPLRRGRRGRIRQSRSK
jgi:hypothetical protein